MTVVFETPRFRVHITDTVAWIENRESDAGWVLRQQLTVPASVESLNTSSNASTLKAAVLDFEDSRPGDTSLRAALTGYRAPSIAQSLPSVNAKPLGMSRTVAIRRVKNVNQIWSPRPLRPPLSAKLA